jgi:DNA-binding MarR family transcriptional regulator
MLMSNDVGTNRTGTETELVDRLRVVLNRGSRQLRLTYVDESLSPSQLEVLSTIVRRGPLRLSQLAREEALNPTMLSRIVAKLEDAGLAQRRSDEADGRVVHVAATEKGRELHEVIRNQRTHALADALIELSTKDRLILEKAMPALESLVETLKQRN